MPGSTPHSSSRPISFETRSWITSAAKPHVSRASASPFAPYASIDLAVATPGAGVCEVVREHLLRVGAAELGEASDGLADRLVRQLDRGRGRLQIGGRHERDITGG